MYKRRNNKGGARKKTGAQSTGSKKKKRSDTQQGKCNVNKGQATATADARREGERCSFECRNIKGKRDV